MGVGLSPEFTDDQLDQQGPSWAVPRLGQGQRMAPPLGAPSPAATAGPGGQTLDGWSLMPAQFGQVYPISQQVAPWTGTGTPPASLAWPLSVNQAMLNLGQFGIPGALSMVRIPGTNEIVYTPPGVYFQPSGSPMTGTPVLGSVANALGGNVIGALESGGQIPNPSADLVAQLSGTGQLLPTAQSLQAQAQGGGLFGLPPWALALIALAATAATAGIGGAVLGPALGAAEAGAVGAGGAAAGELGALGGLAGLGGEAVSAGAALGAGGLDLSAISGAELAALSSTSGGLGAGLAGGGAVDLSTLTGPQISALLNVPGGLGSTVSFPEVSTGALPSFPLGGIGEPIAPGAPLLGGAAGQGPTGVLGTGLSGTDLFNIGRLLSTGAQLGQSIFGGGGQQQDQASQMAALQQMLQGAQPIGRPLAASGGAVPLRPSPFVGGMLASQQPGAAPFFAQQLG